MNPWCVGGIVFAAFLILLAVTYAILMMPVKRYGREAYKGIKYAHRGLHGAGVPENSLEAFRLAVENGFGIELDVHTIKDGTAVVFHDATLLRMVGVDKPLRELTFDELSGYSLDSSEWCIPTFDEVLKLVGGRVPLMVELKQDAGESGVATAAAELLKNYEGDYMVESFNPFTLAEFAREMPDVKRGILSQKFTIKPEHRTLKFFLAQHLLLNIVCKPDFIAYNHKDGRFLPLRFIKKIFNAPTIAWTVRSAEEEKIAYENGFDSIIFENYIPEK